MDTMVEDTRNPGAAGVRVDSAGQGPRRRFYVWMATAVVVAVALGFGRSIPRRLAGSGALSLPVLLHALLFLGWVLIFLVQVGLIARGRIRVHRRLGAMAAALGAAMLVTAPPLATAAAARGSLPGDPLAFLLVMMMDLVFFGFFVAAGVYSRRRAETHKRFMLLATLSLLPPAVSRWPIADVHPALVTVPMLVLLTAAPLDDLRRHCRPHPVSLWGGIAYLVSIPVRFAVAATPAWHHFARWLIR